MSDITKARWLDDQRGPRGGRLAGGWWRCVCWVTATGLLCAIATWGWRNPVGAALTVATLGGLVVFPLYIDDGIRGIWKVVDSAVAAGLVVTGAAGLLAVAGALGALVLAALAASAPSTRYWSRELGRVLRAGHRRPAGPPHRM